MRGSLAVSSLLACMLLVAGCAPDSATPERFLAPSITAQGNPAVVPAFLCAVVFGGQWTVPGGSDIVVNQRWEAKTKGLVQDFLNAQTTTLAVNGGPPADVSDFWGPIAQVPSVGDYRTSTSLPTGVTLATGDAMTFDLALAMSHPVLDGFTLAEEHGRQPLFFGPGVAFNFPCTVTAN
jgi:hypothetical protein